MAPCHYRSMGQGQQGPKTHCFLRGLLFLWEARLLCSSEEAYLRGRHFIGHSLHGQMWKHSSWMLTDWTVGEPRSSNSAYQAVRSGTVGVRLEHQFSLQTTQRLASHCWTQCSHSVGSAPGDLGYSSHTLPSCHAAKATARPRHRHCPCSCRDPTGQRCR